MQRDELIKETIRYIIYLESYRKGQVKLIQRELIALYALIQDQTNEKKKIDFAILAGLITVWFLQIDKFSKSMQNHLNEQASKLAQLENNFMQKSLNDATGEKKKLNKLTPEEIAGIVAMTVYLNRTLSEQISAFTSSQKKIIRAAARSEFNKNNQNKQTTTPEDISKAIKKILKRSLEQTSSFVSTSLGAISNEARSQIIEKNKATYDAYLYVALLDNHTCPLCLTRNGKIFKDKKEAPLPAHWKCRCEYVPIIKNKYQSNPSPLNQKAVIGHQDGSTSNSNIPSTIDVDSYLRMQPLWFIEDVLGGKAKAQLFLNGGLSIKDFVLSATSSKIRTLDDLYELYPEAFEEAGIIPPSQT